MTTDVTAKDFNPSNNDMVDLIKGKANELAAIVNMLPESKRRDTALTHLESCSMFAVKAVFYNDDNTRTEA